MEVEYLRQSEVYAVHNLYYGDHGNGKRHCPDDTWSRATLPEQDPDEDRHGGGGRATSPLYDKLCLDLYLPSTTLQQKSALQSHVHREGRAAPPQRLQQELRSLARHVKEGTPLLPCCTSSPTDWDAERQDGCRKTSPNGESSLDPPQDTTAPLREDADVVGRAGAACREADILPCETSRASLPPLAVFVHGGGWRRGDRKAWRHYVSCEDTNLLVALWLWLAGLYGNVGVDLASSGVACAVLSYPLASPSLAVFLLELLSSYLSGLALVAAAVASGAALLAMAALLTGMEAAIFLLAGASNSHNVWWNPWATTNPDQELAIASQDSGNGTFFGLGLDNMPVFIARTFGWEHGQPESSSLSNFSAVGAFSSIAETWSVWGVTLTILCTYHLVLLVVIAAFRKQYRLHRRHVAAMATVAMATVTLSAILAHLDVVDVSGALQIFYVISLLLVHLPHLRWRLAAPRDEQAGQVEAVAGAVRWLQHWGRQRALYDPTRSVLIGHSAGGHLVSLLGLDAPLMMSSGCSPHHIKAVISVSGVYDLRLLAKTGFLRHFYLHPAFGRDVTHWDATSPLQRARCLATTVPQWRPAFLLVRAASEGVAATTDSHALFRLLRHAGCRVRHVIVPGCNHFSVIMGLGGREVDKGETLLKTMVDFVKEHTSPE